MIKIRKCYEQLDFAPDGVHGRKAHEKWKFAKLFHMFNFDFFSVFTIILRIFIALSYVSITNFRYSIM